MGSGSLLVMRSQRIYVDTSVIGGCFDAEFAQWSNALFSDFEIGTYLPVVSEIVAAEVEDAPEAVQQKYADLLALGAEILEVDPGIIALATAAEVDLLVSWNFKHIVHYQKIRLFN